MQVQALVITPNNSPSAVTLMGYVRREQCWLRGDLTLEVVQDSLHSSPLLTSGSGPFLSASGASSVSSTACTTREH